MKSLRLGNFRSILDMLGPDEQRDDEKARPPATGARLRSSSRALKDDLDRIPDARRQASYMPIERLAGLYCEAQAEDAPPVFAPADDAAVAAELRLSAARTGDDLRRIRRSFAMRNHPDRVPDWLREEATRRMRIANALIDQAMRDKLKKRPRG